MEEKKIVLNINGIEYKALEEVPEEYRKLISPEILEKIKSGSGNFPQTQISSIGKVEHNINFADWALYISTLIISTLENWMVVPVIRLTESVIGINKLISFLVSFVIGNISYFVAYKYIKRNNLNITLFDKFEVLILSLNISLGLQVIFMLGWSFLKMELNTM